MTNTDTPLKPDVPDVREARGAMVSAMAHRYGDWVGILEEAVERIDAALTKPAVPDVREALTEAEAWLRECSAWLLSTDLDMTCPMETDPLDIADKLAALTQSPTCCEAERWQPIETAPKGQGLIDIWTTHHGGTRYASCYYDNICSEWRTSRPAGRLHRIPERFVTHWQPLPEPPATAIRGADQ